jgi:hypothetical protein
MSILEPDVIFLSIRVRASSNIQTTQFSRKRLFIDDGMWRAFLLDNQTFEQLWEEVRKCIFPNLTQEYFKDFTKEFFGATEYDWN